MGGFRGKSVVIVCAQYLLAQQANRPPPPQPYYMPVPAPAPAPRNCISNVNGNTIYTNCN